MLLANLIKPRRHLNSASTAVDSAWPESEEDTCMSKKKNSDQKKYQYQVRIAGVPATPRTAIPIIRSSNPIEGTR